VAGVGWGVIVGRGPGSVDDNGRRLARPRSVPQVVSR
jgi:hypothetical protein